MLHEFMSTGNEQCGGGGNMSIASPLSTLRKRQWGTVIRRYAKRKQSAGEKNKVWSK